MNVLPATALIESLPCLFCLSVTFRQYIFAHYSGKLSLVCTSGISFSHNRFDKSCILYAHNGRLMKLFVTLSKETTVARPSGNVHRGCLASYTVCSWTTHFQLSS